MFVHTVFFWLKPGITADEEKQFVAGVNSLLTISSMKHGWVGKPADTSHEVIDRSYSYGLTTVFADEAGHDAYQVDPIHDRFRDIHHLWTGVKIYDYVT